VLAADANLTALAKQLKTVSGMEARTSQTRHPHLDRTLRAAIHHHPHELPRV